MATTTTTLDKLREQRLAATRGIIVEHMRARKLASVSIAYDGCNGEAKIKPVEARDSKGQLVDITRIPFDHRRHPTLDRYLQEYAWDVLDTMPGFEASSGGYGTIQLEAVDGTGRLTHTKRVVEDRTTQTDL